MTLKPGDWVEADTGDIGKVVHISRRTVFVAIAIPGMDDVVETYLENELTKTERPERQ